MVMSVIMFDARLELKDEWQALFDRGGLAALLYADDTLLISVSQQALQAFLDAVAAVGGRFGLELHWGKFQLIEARCNPNIHRQDG